MAYGNREKSSGGPFFRDIQFQSGGDTEIYNYMNSGHAQTENWRMGLHGPYALIFTTGSTPAVPDFSWMSGLNLQGWVSSRGNVVLNGLSGMIQLTRTRLALPIAVPNTGQRLPLPDRPLDTG